MKCYYITGSNWKHREQRGGCCIFQFASAPFYKENTACRLPTILPGKHRSAASIIQNLPPMDSLGLHEFNRAQDDAARIRTLCLRITEEYEHDGIFEFKARVCVKEDGRFNQPYRHMHYDPKYPYPLGTEFVGFVFEKNNCGILKIESPAP